jgi:hypothetical protein
MSQRRLALLMVVLQVIGWTLLVACIVKLHETEDSQRALLMERAANYAYITIPPGTTVTYGGVIRFPPKGPWEFLRDGSHVTTGYIKEPYCDHYGRLWLYYEPLKNVATVIVNTDESLSRKGIVAGASVNVAYEILLFTRMTKDGPVRVNCGNPTLRGASQNVWVGVVGQPQ